MALDLRKVQKLAAIVKSQQEERERYRKAEDIKTERQRTIDQAPTPWTTEFWCQVCSKDYIRLAHKIVISSYEEPIAFYESKCPKGHYCRRRITDKMTDPYYFQSEQLRRARVELERDLIQPGDPRFKRIYGDPYKKHYEELEKIERDEHAKRKNQ